MPYRPGDTIYLSFTTQSATGASADADSAPTLVLRRNGAADATVTVSLAHNGAGDYTASAALPSSYAGGDDVELVVMATIAGVAARNILPLGKLERPVTLASSQSFNNTGQTTPLPGASLFAGPNSVTLLFQDASAHVVGGVTFTVAGIGSMTAGSDGHATFSLPAGTYTVRATPANGLLWPDTTLTVSGTTSLIITATAIAIASPASPSQTTAYLTTRDGQGAAIGGITLTFQLIDPQAATDSYNQSTFTAESNSSGLLQTPLLKSTKYQARVGGGPWVPFTTGYDATFALPEILGSYS